MNLRNFDVSDFLMEESFFYWVKNPGGEDALFWESLLEVHPEKRDLANQAKRILNSMTFKDKGFNKEEIKDIWEGIKKETVVELNSISSTGGKTIGFLPLKYMKVAAVILPFIIASVLLIFYSESPDAQQADLQQRIEKYNPKGQKLTVFLSDGSKVKLNAESRLTYTKPFDPDKRVVKLEGEAFFEVTPDKKRPFIVTSGNLETKVLGTSFNVKAYPNDGRIDVAVKTGIVSVSSQDKNVDPKKAGAVVLSPTEMVTYTQSNNHMSVSVYDPKEVLAWSEGALYFNNATMEEFVAKLERWYGVDIIVERKEPIKKGIVGEFKDQSLEEILIGTQDVSEFKYEFKDDKLFIK